MVLVRERRAHPVRVEERHEAVHGGASIVMLGHAHIYGGDGDDYLGGCGCYG